MTRNFRNLNLLFFTLLVGISCFGQSNSKITFNNLIKKDGLPSSTVRSIENDKLGFLWIATNDGLCRYDGPDVFKVYRKSKTSNQSMNSLESDNIRTLLCDESGLLWIGTWYGGISTFNPSTNQWRTFRHDVNDSQSIDHDEVLAIFEDSKKRIWVGTENGLNLFNRETSKFERIALSNSKKERLSSTAVISITEDDNGWIWVGTWSNGLHLLLENENGDLTFNSSRQINLPFNREANNVWCVYQDKSGRYWLGTHGGGLILMSIPSQASNKISDQNWSPNYHQYLPQSQNARNLRSNAVQSIMQDSQGKLWIGTTHGLYCINEDKLPKIGNKDPIPLDLEFFLNSPKDPQSIVGNNIVEINEDDQGLIWIATTDGLSQINLHSNQFVNLDFTNLEHGLPFSSNLVFDKRNRLWVAASNEGLLQYTVENGNLVLQKENLSDLILGKEVQTIFTPDKEWMYIGTEKGVTALEIRTNKVSYYPLVISDKSVKSLNITSIYVDSKKFIWVGTKIGLFKIHPKTKAFNIYEPIKNVPSSISDHPVNHIMEDKYGDIWIATYKGLNRVINKDEEDLKFEKFFYNEMNPEKGPIDNQIMYLKHINNYLYVGTVSGICRYNYSTKKFESFDNSKQKYWVRSIEKGLNNSLWISTNEGLIHRSENDNSFRVYDKEDGLESSTFQLGSSCVDNQGKLYFASYQGLVHFNPKDITRNVTPPSVYITEVVKMTSKGLETNEGIQKNKITLDHDTYRLSINFTAINYDRADKNKYEYRLEGFEDQWNEAKLGTPIVYTSLKPDDYTLKVRAANSDGIWNKEGTELEITQNAAYWETWWFRILFLIAFISLLSLFTYWYTSNIKKHNEELQIFNKNLNEEISNRKKIEQTLNDYNTELKRSNKDLEQFAYISSHDLKEPLRSIGNFSSLLAKKYDDKLDKDAKTYLSFIQNGVKRMNEVIESLLTYSTVGKKDSVYNTFDLNPLVKNKINDLSRLIKDKNAKVVINELPSIIAQKEQIGMVFFNLINNAIKFNIQEQPLVVISQEKSDDDKFWKFSVKDNGIGIKEEYQEKVFDIFNRLHGKEEYEGTGIGLAICQKIITRHLGKIWFKSELDKGTSFYFTIKKNLDKENTVL